MSNALAARGVLTALMGAIKAAWPDIQSIDTLPPSSEDAVPFAVVDWGPVSVSASQGSATMRKPEQHLSFVITGVFPVPSGKQPTIEQLDRADAMIAQLQAAPSFSGATMPLVTHVDPTIGPITTLQNVVYLQLMFECDVQVDHH